MRGRLLRYPKPRAGAFTKTIHMADRNDFSIVRFSTDDLPEKDRATIWREHFGPSVFKVEIEPPPPDTPLKVDMASRSLPGLQLLLTLHARTHDPHPPADC